MSSCFWQWIYLGQRADLLVDCLILFEQQKIITMKLQHLLLLSAVCIALFVDCRRPIIGGKKKPIIYLYPTTETVVNVKIETDGKLTHTYPKYNPETGWTVTAKPDGTLFDANGKEFYALFWEDDEFKAIPDKGFVVKGSETAAFLEEKLEILGLNRKEANEFIVYWLPQMENNPYNLIHFAEKSYTNAARLTVTPKPETMIRVFMVFKALPKEKQIEKQVLTPITRKGFTVVEWGGTEMDELNF